MMSISKRVVAILTLGVVAVGVDGPLNEAKAGPTTYSLFCRGGEAQTIIFKYDHWKSGLLSGSSMTASSSFSFLKSSTPYSPNTLKPSQCAWVDRGIKSTEPSEVRYDAVTHTDDTFVAVTLTSKAKVKTTIAGKVQPQASWSVLNALSDSNSIVELKVAAENGVFKVHGFGVIASVPSANPYH